MLGEEDLVLACVYRNTSDTARLKLKEEIVKRKSESINTEEIYFNARKLEKLL